MNPKTFALILFIATYVLMIALPKRRPLVALISAVIFVATGVLPLGNVLGAIDFNVLLMLAGTMGTVFLFIDSRMPNRLAEVILRHTPNVMWVVVAMSLFAGIVSAFIDNVATVLMIAPVGLAIAKKLDISPVTMIICIAVSSNLQGAATLVGDTTSIMLGGYAGMDFLDFFFMEGKPSIFWAVELGALATIPVIMFLFRKQKEPVTIDDTTEVEDYFPTVLLVATVVLLICASFVPDKPSITNGVICVCVFLVGAVRSLIRTKSWNTVKRALADIDYQTLILLASLFVVIEGITEAGIITDISNLFVRLGGDNLFLLYTVIVWGSVAFSAFVDNIPYVATMLPVVTSIAATLGIDPTVLYFGLLTGATLGGNLTPIGASANIAGIGILRKGGYEVKTSDFMRIGVPFTLVAVTAGYLFCWLVWA
ncbi:MAG: TRAP transporter large permease subunit [Oscillospiraceae bacterium]|nr:TRAP transporter large permease subunit [Oscillospiraceae bacterium]MDD6502266.1 SLC13 family permease [Oscillospiraceae bacterium]